MKKKKLWFRAKRYGWGWYPCSWEGWACIGVFMLLTLIAVPLFGPLSFIPITIMAAILVYVSYKTGEPPRWRWGK